MKNDNGEKTDLDVINEWLAEIKAGDGATETDNIRANMLVRHGCKTCKHFSKLITEDPCFDCDPRKGSGRDYWEFNDG